MEHCDVLHKVDAVVAAQVADHMTKHVLRRGKLPRRDAVEQNRMQLLCAFFGQAECGLPAFGQIQSFAPQVLFIRLFAKKAALFQPLGR